MSVRKNAHPPRNAPARRVSKRSSLIVKDQKSLRSAQGKSALDNRFHRTA